MQSKRQLRAAILKQRKKLSLAQRRHATQAISAQIAQTPVFKRSKHLAFYLPTGSEVNPLSLLQKAVQMNKKCYLPVLHPLKHNLLWFIEYQPQDSLIKNRFGIFEPKINLRKKIPAKNLNVVFMPLVAFDAEGNRLGSGKGYYDRTFSFLKKSNKSQVQLVGLAYEMQKVPQIGHESWDVPLHSVVTERRIYNFSADV